MKIKSKLFSLTMILVSIIAISLFALPLSNAHVPSQTIPTYAYLRVVPDPVGVGQTTFVNMWLDKTPPTASGLFGDRWQNFTVTITKPDGTTQILGPYKSDDVGGANVIYNPDQIGNYSFVFNFPGQTLAGANPPPTGNTSPFINDTFSGSTSTREILTVQSQPIPTYQQAPIPTGYWQNPVESFDSNWNTISGNWLGLGAANFAATGQYNHNGNFNPYTTAALSAHIVWTKTEAVGGLLGGEFGNSENAVYYTGMQYEPKFAPIIMNGILYYTQVPGASTTPTGWVALDLRTGQTLWTFNTTQWLANGQIMDYTSLNQYGAVPYLWGTNAGSVSGSSALSFSGTIYSMYDALTGTWILNIVNCTGFASVEGTDGSILGYFVNTTAHTLNLWNSTQAIITATGFQGTPEWRPPQGANIPFSMGIMWSKPIATDISGVPIGPPPLSLAATVLDLDSGVAILKSPGGGAAVSSNAFLWEQGWQIEAGYSMSTGQLLWGPINRTETPYTAVVMGPAGNGIFTEYNKEELTWTAYSSLNGQKLWGPTTPYSNPWGYYDQNSAVIAYGNLYAWTLGGYVYSYNLTTGALEWSWNTGNSGEDTPYGVYPLWIIGSYENAVGGGVIYVAAGHCYGPPLFPGAKLYALNATSGGLLWSILSFDVSSTLALVNGYLLGFNAYDGMIYNFGRGLTATTVSAPQTSIAQGHSLTITGSVTDQSPGKTCLGIPAAGTPAISDDSMTPWMQYLYMQQPMPTNATGVPVQLTAIDPNGNYQNIGKATTDIHGNFGIQWVPPVPGLYQVTATFAGSHSYFDSSATTYFSVESAPSASITSPAPSTTAPIITPTSSASGSISPSTAPAPGGIPSTELYIIAAALIIIIAIVAVAFVLRKRK